MSTVVATQMMAVAPVPQRAAQITERVPAQERPAALPALTGLRFFAASWVVWHHVVSSWAWGLIPTAGALWNLSFGGYQGVTLFFILSGFILAHTYLGPSGRVRGTARAFWLARLARVYPVYLLGALVGLGPYLWSHAAGATPLRTGLSVLTLTQSWQPAVGTALNAPGWSLSVEAFFYALFPLLAPLVGRLRARGLLATAVLCWLVGLVPGIMYIALNPDHVASTALWNNGLWLWVVQYLPLLHLPEFMLGLALGRLFGLRGARGSSSPRASRLSPRYPWALLGLGSGAVLLALVPWPYVLLHCGLLTPCFALLLWGLAAGQEGLARLLSQPALVVLGEASYALYILHVPLFAWYQRYVWAALPASGVGTVRGALALVSFALLLVALCLLVFRSVEQPARCAIRARFSRRGSAFCRRLSRGKLPALRALWGWSTWGPARPRCKPVPPGGLDRRR